MRFSCVSSNKDEGNQWGVLFLLLHNKSGRAGIFIIAQDEKKERHVCTSTCVIVIVALWKYSFVFLVIVNAVAFWVMLTSYIFTSKGSATFLYNMLRCTRSQTHIQVLLSYAATETST